MDTLELKSKRQMLLENYQNLIDNTIELKNTKEQIVELGNGLYVGPNQGHAFDYSKLLSGDAALQLRTKYLDLIDQWIEAQEDKLSRIEQILDEHISIEEL